MMSLPSPDRAGLSAWRALSRCSRGRGRARSGLEEDVDHAALKVSLANVGETREELEHASVLREHVGAKATDAARLGRIEEGAKDDRPDALALVSVLHDESDLDGVGLVGRLVSCHRDELRAMLDHEGQAALIVHAGEHARPVGWQ